MRCQTLTLLEIATFFGTHVGGMYMATTALMNAVRQIVLCRFSRFSLTHRPGAQFLAVLWISCAGLLWTQVGYTPYPIVASFHIPFFQTAHRLFYWLSQHCFSIWLQPNEGVLAHLGLSTQVCL